MERLRMLRTVTGPDGPLKQGKVYVLSGGLARDLADAGAAVLMTAPPAPSTTTVTTIIEAATVEAPENAARRTRRTRGHKTELPEGEADETEV